MFVSTIEPRQRMRGQVRSVTVMLSSGRQYNTCVDYPAAIEFLLSFADFERTGRFQERPDVAPMHALLRELGDPHLGRQTVHVAGSKGKGSVCAMVESVLRAAGRTTGLYTSPHLHDYTERVQIGGRPISRTAFARLAGELRPAVGRAQQALAGRGFVTFDLLTALGFLAFREAGVDAQVIEVGLGGRVDSTNVFPTKEAAVITALSYEHMAILGDTIEQIAAEKAAIITPGCAAVLGRQEFPGAESVVRDHARRAGARLVDVACEYRVTVRERSLRGQLLLIEGPGGSAEVRLPLAGGHQAENAATAVAVADVLGVQRDAVARGLAAVRWPGRLEVLCELPLVVADGAHNRESARRLREALLEYTGAPGVTFVIGMGADKDLDGLAAELAPVAGRVYAARSLSPRAQGPGRISAAFRALGTPAEDVESVAAALGRALAATDKGGVICLAGSLFVAAEGREYFGKRETVGGD